MKQVLFRAAIVLLVIYLVFLAMIAWAMRQPPERFGRFMAKMPVVGFIILPFETLWTQARAGHLQPGDPAPEFDLTTLDKTQKVQLSSFRGRQPVVLVFGSYT